MIAMQNMHHWPFIVKQERYEMAITSLFICSTQLFCHKDGSKVPKLGVSQHCLQATTAALLASNNWCRRVGICNRAYSKKFWPLFRFNLAHFVDWYITIDKFKCSNDDDLGHRHILQKFLIFES